MQPPSLLQDKWRREERLQRLIAFALPALAFYFGFVAHGLWPFGNRHLLAYDLYHQYAPFLLELKRKILSGDSLFFSWSGGLGVDYYSIFTYYTASPLNLLTLLFPDRYIAEAVSLITILKIGLASLFFREFLTGAFRRRDPLASLFSAFYALSAWVYAYSWNIMWLDTLVLFPLACLGLVQLVRDRRPGRFILALTLMLMTNYYAAFFACVFLFLYYFLVRIQFPGQAGQGLKARLIPFGLFAGSSLLSALLSAVILWPTAKALSITSAAGDAFPSGFSFNQPLLDTLGRMTPLSSPHIMSGLPNIIAGLFVLFLVPAFLPAGNAPLKSVSPTASSWASSSSPSSRGPSASSGMAVITPILWITAMPLSSFSWSWAWPTRRWAITWPPSGPGQPSRPWSFSSSFSLSRFWGRIRAVFPIGGSGFPCP